MSSTFEQALKSTLNNEVSITENGAAGYKTAGNPLLDMHFAASSLRKKSDAEVLKMFSDAYHFDPVRAVQWMFMLRDVRGGMGERRSFRICFGWLIKFKSEVAMKLLDLIPEYGRWDDLIVILDGLADASFKSAIFKLIDKQLSEDYANINENKSISLLAKWMPSINTSSPKTRALARLIIKELGLSEVNYRKMLSALRRRLNVLEVDASSKNWSAINYEAVPSMANLKYKNAFLRNDEVRRREYLGKLSTGETKINSSVSFPSDIVHKYTRGWSIGQYDSALEAMWKALPDVAINGNLICVCDGSGSMTTTVDSKSSVTALEVCNALGIYCSEHLTGPFKDKYITFSDRPQYVDLSNATSLHEKLEIAINHNEVASTNIEAVFDLILETAVRNKLEQKEIPDICVLSDMEFNEGVNVGNRGSIYSMNYESLFNARTEALFEQIGRKWQSYGYSLPRLIYWNIASRTNTVPLQQNSNGIVLCSGYSQSLFKMLQSNKTDPYEVLCETLDSERYAAVKERIS